MSRLFTIWISGMCLALAAPAGSLYFQGFETNTSGWVPDTGSGSPDGSITRVASGGGTLHLTAPDGSFYAEVANSPNAYSVENGLPNGYGTGGFSTFGNSTIPPYPGSAFVQSMDVYIDTSLTMAPGVQQGFWIDDTPSSTDSADAPGGFGFGAEHNYRLAYDGSSVAITVDGELLPLLTITTSGWYDFEFLYSQSDANPTDISNTTMIFTSIGGSVLASEVELNNADGETLQNQFLAGPGYMWLPVWANGFSNDVLGIDDLQAFTATPEPSSFLLLGLGLAAFAHWKRKSARANA